MDALSRDLKGAALDWAFFKATNVNAKVYLASGSAMVLYTPKGKRSSQPFNPQSNPKLVFPFIEELGISVVKCDGRWVASSAKATETETYGRQGDYCGSVYAIDADDDRVVTGDTMLVATMRCIVLAKLGEWVVLPDVGTVGGKVVW